MKRPRPLSGCLLFVLALARLAAPMRAATEARPETLGFSPERLERLDRAIQAEVGQHRIAGVVAYVARDGQPVRFRGHGMQNIASAEPMSTDAIFRIASMSKAVTTVAVMMRYEDGRFTLHDPLGKFIPGFKNSVVAAPPPADAPSGAKFVTAPAKRPIQIHDLLTHTA